MVTSQPQSAAGPMGGADSTAGPSSTMGGGDGSQSGSYKIEIRVGADKSLSVCVEQGEDGDSGYGADASGGSGGADSTMGGDSTMDSGSGDTVPVKSIKEALTLCLEIYRNDGQLPQQADEAFQQGFQGGSA